MLIIEATSTHSAGSTWCQAHVRQICLAEVPDCRYPQGVSRSEPVRRRHRSRERTGFLIGPWALRAWDEARVRLHHRQRVGLYLAAASAIKSLLKNVIMKSVPSSASENRRDAWPMTTASHGQTGSHRHSSSGWHEGWRASGRGTCGQKLQARKAGMLAVSAPVLPLHLRSAWPRRTAALAPLPKSRVGNTVPQAVVDFILTLTQIIIDIVDSNAAKAAEHLRRSSIRPGHRRQMFKG